jgi:hypothetical protein
MRATWAKWQIEESGPLVTAKGSHPWYGRNSWKKGFRIAELQRHPICILCQRNASQMVDHIRPFINPEGYVSWALFSSPENHRALCNPCHNRLTSTYDGGFGNARKAGKETHCQPTGEAGKQFASTSMTNAELDKALGTDEDLAALLAGIPE